MSSEAGALVSIGIPTYNRARTLERALCAARAQTHRELEILVYDNASADGTRAVAERHAGEDARVRYRRQERNLGPTANFNALFAACRGEWVMMLADDDWPAEDYVERCLAAHRAHPGAALVSGVAVYHRGEQVVEEGARVQLPQASPAARVRGYYEQVRDNGTFYGLMPAGILRRAAPLRNVLGNDWLLIAAVAFQGTVHTIEEARLHRELDGTSVDISSIARTFGSSPWQARAPHLVIAAQALADIGWRAEVYRSLAPPARLTLAVGAARRAIDWRSLAWHILTPIFLALRARPRGRRLYRAYDRLIRRLGAGGLPPGP